MNKPRDETTGFVRSTKNSEAGIATRPQDFSKNREVTQRVKAEIQWKNRKPGEVNRILIQFPYSQELIKKVKTISGSRWNPKGRYWEVPYNDSIILKLQNLFGESLQEKTKKLPAGKEKGKYQGILCIKINRG